MIAVLILLVLGMSRPAAAQGQCMASLNVLPDRNVTVLNFGNLPGDSISTTMSCLAAEQMRESMFTSGEAISASVFDDLATLKNKLADVNRQLGEQKAALVAATTKAKRGSVLGTLAGLGGVVGVMGSTAGCVELKVTSCTKLLLAASAIFVAVESASTSAGDLKREADAAVAQIDTLTSAQSELMQRMSAAQAGQYKLRYNAAFTALCSSIRQQCLR